MIGGKKLRAIREARAITQAEVGRRMGIGPVRVSTIESERRGTVTPKTAVRYLKAIAPDDEVSVTIHVIIRGFIGDECVLEEGQAYGP